MSMEILIAYKIDKSCKGLSAPIPAAIMHGNNLPRQGVWY